LPAVKISKAKAKASKKETLPILAEPINQTEQAKPSTNTPSNQSRIQSNMSPNQTTDGGGLRFIGWLLIIVGLILLLVVSILLGILLMLLGLLFVVVGKKG